MIDSAKLRRLAVIGAGAWGTALALAAARNGGAGVTLWAHEADVVDDINQRHVNSLYLPGIELPANLRATNNMAAAAADADALLLVTPAQHLRGVCRNLAPHLAAGAALVICAKGVELESGELLSEIVAETCPTAKLAVLSGPTFAGEVAQGRPTAVTLAVQDATLGATLVAALGAPNFRPYLSDDIVGAQIGGAVKNVIAIACGVVDGKRLGDNARAAVITRGLAEMMRLGAALGGKRETMMGLAGLGDLTLTCNSRQSRNMSLGVALGEGKTLAQATEGKRSIAEGAVGAASVHALARRVKIEMPIVSAVNDILHHGAPVERAIAGLLERPFRNED